MGRKNLNDVIHGDRADIRGGKKGSKLDNWFGKDGDNDDFTGKKSGGSKSYTSYAPRCATTHPALMLPGTDKVIYGGSCSSPVVEGADVYIGFDYSMKKTVRSWPWKKGTEFLFEIQDMGVPKLPDEFKKMVKWVKQQVDAGLKVHCGCIGGHGRTGMFLAALVSEYGEKDAINYVRKNYCHKAVESSTQVNFLHTEFGITKVTGHKEGNYTSNKGGASKGNLVPISTKKKVRTFSPASHSGNIFGECN